MSDLVNDMREAANDVDSIGAEMALIAGADEIDRLRAENERLRAALRDLRYPCTCDPAYYERGLVAPDCMADLCGDDAREALGEPLECKGRKAKVAKARAALEGDGTKNGET